GPQQQHEESTKKTQRARRYDDGDDDNDDAEGDVEEDYEALDEKEAEVEKGMEQLAVTEGSRSNIKTRPSKNKPKEDRREEDGDVVMEDTDVSTPKPECEDSVDQPSKVIVSPKAGKKKAAPTPRAKTAARKKVPAKKQKWSDDEDSDAADDARDAEIQGESDDDGEEDVLTRRSLRGRTQALGHAKQSFDNLQQDERQPEHYCQLIDSLYNDVASMCRHAPDPRIQLQGLVLDQRALSKVPRLQNPVGYLYSARLMDSKDKAMHEIAEQRHKQRQDQ
ncbi:hypothetical protein BGZ99_001756, partial [Dissophora globulifera]